MFWPDHDMGGWTYAGMATGMVLFWVVIVVGIVALIRFSSKTGASQAVQQPQPYTESPEQLLAIRFARGEIDEAEYQQRLAVLRGSMRH